VEYDGHNIAPKISQTRRSKTPSKSVSYGMGKSKYNNEESSEDSLKGLDIDG